MGEDINSVSERGKLEDIPGVGSNLAGKIKEILETGRLAHLEKLKQEYPGVSLNSQRSGVSDQKKHWS